MLLKHTVGRMGARYSIIIVIMVALLTIDGWMADTAQRGQIISFCGVNAHNQNGLAKKATRDLQEQARKSLLHAKTM